MNKKPTDKQCPHHIYMLSALNGLPPQLYGADAELSACEVSAMDSSMSSATQPCPLIFTTSQSQTPQREVS